MYKYFSEEKWSEIFLNPLWYIELLPEYKRLKKLMENSDLSTRNEIKEEIYGFIDDKLTSGKITIASTGENLDKERKPIDTIIIHHTGHPPGISWQKLSAIHLIRLYSGFEGRKEQQEKLRREKKPIWSNHFRNDQQVFYAYHWLIRKDGTIERLLLDNQIGWHSGSWNINTRSIAICIDDNLLDLEPNEKVLKTITKLIKENYSQVTKERIFGHMEINPKTTCPGNAFLYGWKNELIKTI